MATNISFGGDSIVTLHQQELPVRDIVKEQVAIAEREDNGRHFYMCNLGDIIEKYQTWTRRMPRIKLFYAVKCNNDYPVLKILSDLGASFDCASSNEIREVLALGISPARIIYAHPCKQLSMLSFAEQKGVRMMTFDNVEELHKVKQIHHNALLVLRIAITRTFKGRFDLNRKFGCHPSHVSRLLQDAKELGLNVIGISFHVGSNCCEPKAFQEAIKQARRAFDAGIQQGFSMKLLDIGGGFQGDSNTYKNFETITDCVNQSLQEYFPPEEGVEVIAEPGRYVVASAGTIGVSIIAKRVLTTTNTGENMDGRGSVDLKNDTKVMFYVNDGVFGSFLGQQLDEPIVIPDLLRPTADDDVLYESSIWGPTCHSGDVIVESTRLPLLEVGDWLYFQDMGAYTLSLATKFNGMDFPRRVYYCLSDTWYTLYPENSTRDTLKEVSVEGC